MKAVIMACCLAGAAAAQSVSIHSGSGEDQRSNAAEFAGPYVLTWTLRDLPPSKREDPLWKPTSAEEWKRQWLSLSVHDAATGRRICGDLVSGRDGWLNVPAGGKHYVRITGPRNIAWTVHGRAGRMEVTEKGAVVRPATSEKVQPTPQVIRGRKPTAAEMEKIAEPVPPPKPSSVPGLPAGVEPATKGNPPPPGMTKGGKP